MTRSETPAGTPVIEMTDEEYRDFLDREAHARLGISVAEFEQRYTAAELDDADPDVPLLAMWTGMGQNGHQVAA
ncbi:MAG: hypothetical protein ACTHM1_06325 [Solirubrobacteraceae bacterium]